MKVVILDRDGTINVDRDDYVKSADDWEPLPGALEAIARLNHGGWHVVVATNQSGIGRGLFDMAALNAMHHKLLQSLAPHGGRIDAVFFCPHTPDEGCSCRKPLPGLIEDIVQRYGVTPQHTPVIGDSLSDLQAGAALGCPTHLVRTGKTAAFDALQLRLLLDQVPGTVVHADLAAFADHLLGREPDERPASAAPAPA